MSLSPLAVRDANSVSRNVVSHQDASGNYIPEHTLDSTIPHYRYAKADFAAVATPTTAVVIQGSATKTVRVKKVKIAGAATAAGSIIAYLERWSSGGTLGSAALTAIAAAKCDSQNPAATAVVSTVGTANYTTKGTSAGLVGAGRVSLQAIGSAATSGEGQGLEFDFTTRSSQALVLRGTGEYLVIDFNGAGIPSGGKFDFTIETAEDDS